MTDDGINKKEFIERATGPIESCEELSEEMIWSKHGTAIWKADRFVGSPYFYTVYKYHDLYSYSLLNLILHKGTLKLNRRVVQEASKPGFNYYSGMDTIDLEIERVGGTPKPEFLIKEPSEYARLLAKALREDISLAEDNHPGFTNIILCGGKDSQNLLLLPWKNPVLVASGSPNYELVKLFVADNGLSYDVVELDDKNNSLLELDILANCCRNNLEHCRYGYHLRELSYKFGNKVIFWNGQWGDAFTTPHWKTLTHGINYVYKLVPRIGMILGKWGRERSRYYLLEKTGYAQRYFFNILWHRGAMWQGAHQSIMRQITNAVVLSAYHGPAIKVVFSEVDLFSAVREDIRPMIGEYLHGSPVLYPSENPGPPLSEIRKGISHAEPFIKVLSSMGITIQ